MNAKYEDIFYQALRIRMVEEKITELYPSDKIQSPVHLSVGQEHHIAAIMSRLKKEDQVFTTYRGHAVYLAKGGDIKKMFAELFGKSTGISKGKAGSMHLTAPEVNMMGSSAIVGATLSHTLGAAYALKFFKKDNIVVSVTGDGSTEEGVFNECLNFASLKRLPLLFVIENNGLAIHSPLKTRQSFSLKKLADAYCISYYIIEDNFDMDKVASMTEEITRKIKETGTPAILEIMTYRYRGHVGVEEDFKHKYRDRSECEKYEKRDPLINNRDLISKFGKRIEKEINDAVAFAEQSPFPDQCDLLKGCY
ncbi:MAG: thiamine pyrophosphate-dependent dehydrogenase E1 component subunit alpha [Elusimicrobiota bacterium]